MAGNLAARASTLTVRCLWFLAKRWLAIEQRPIYTIVLDDLHQRTAYVTPTTSPHLAASTVTHVFRSIAATAGTLPLRGSHTTHPTQRAARRARQAANSHTATLDSNRDNLTAPAPSRLLARASGGSGTPLTTTSGWASSTPAKRSGGRSGYMKMSTPVGSGLSPTESSGERDSEVREEYDRMEKWLDEHPEFVHDYFARKARRSMVDGWLIAHALSHSGLSTGAPGDALSTSSTTSSNSKPSSGANTPVRKISAQEFEKGGLLRPIVSTVDGTLTFLDPSPSSTPTRSSKPHRRSKSELKALDEKELMYELVIDICNDLDVTSLCYKILQNLSILLNADRCSLFLVQGKGTNEKSLVSKLFDVSSDSTYEEICDREQEIRVPWGTGIIGYVAQTGEAVNIPDAYQVRIVISYTHTRMHTRAHTHTHTPNAHTA